MSRGCDYSRGRPSNAALYAAGIGFVVRYACQDFPDTHDKILFPPEAERLLTAGFSLGLVHEWYERRIREGAGAGWADAGVASAQAAACGMPTIPVYFVCDYDAPGSDQPLIHDTLRGAADRIGADRARNLYGGFWPIHRAFDAGVIHRAWQTFAWSAHPIGAAVPANAVVLKDGALVGGHPLPASPDWADGWLYDPRAQLRQGPRVWIGGVECDIDQATATDYGQWPRPATPTTISEEDPMEYRPGNHPVPLHDRIARLRFCTTATATTVRVDFQPAGDKHWDTVEVPLRYDAGANGVAVPVGCDACVVRWHPASDVPAEARIGLVLVPGQRE